MSRRILHYTLEVVEGPQTLVWPKGNIIHVNSKRFGFVTLWVEVQDDLVEVSRTFQLFATGQDIPEDAQYIGTSVQYPVVENMNQLNEPLVWHVYERLV